MNFEKLLPKLRVNFPGLPKIPRAPDTFSHRQFVDIYFAKKSRELANMLPNIDPQNVPPPEHGNRNLLADLMAAGYSIVVDELTALAREEQIYLESNECSFRSQSFLEDVNRVGELLMGLTASADAEKSGSTLEVIRIRKTLGEKMIALGDFWLARKLLTSCFVHLQIINDDMDKYRVELWCLISYLCIYFEESQETGLDLPTKYLSWARKLSRDKPWYMQKSIMNIVVPKAINVYGLKNDWIKIKVEWVNLYNVSTSLLHVLSVKKARFWQEELEMATCPEESRVITKNINDSLASALNLADEVRQYSAFTATVLRRGLFLEELGETEKAMQDFDALSVLAVNFDDQESQAMAMNRFGQNNIRKGDVVSALDYFTREFEVATENNFSELGGDALQEIGHILLQEGHLWEADECYSQAFQSFHSSKEDDTPNDLDDLTWAMSGVAKGQQIWSRYTTLLRSEQPACVDAVMHWKCTRKPLPLAFPPPFVANKKEAFEKQYFSGGGGKRRLFEFNPELKVLQWFDEMMDKSLFNYINNSKKPRDVPEFYDDDDDTDLDVLLVNDSFDDNLDKRRSTAEHLRAKSMAESLRRTLLLQRATFDKVINNTVEKDYQRTVWKRKPKVAANFSYLMQDPDLPFEDKLQVLLDDLENMTKATDASVYFRTPPPTPSSAAASKLEIKKSKIPSDILKEYLSFDEKDWHI